MQTATLATDKILFSWDGAIARITLNRPDKANALDAEMWQALEDVFVQLKSMQEIRCVILQAAGKHFCSGIDHGFLMTLPQLLGNDQGRNALIIQDFIKKLQRPFDAMEACGKVIIAAVDGLAIGAGLDLLAACDLRYASSNAKFSLKEVDLAIVSDMGSLQRLPKMIADHHLREMAFTGDNYSAEQAYAMGLIGQVCSDHEALLNFVQSKALAIAAKSPVALLGIKQMLLFARDHSVKENLDFVAQLNASLLQSGDIALALMAKASKQEAVFPPITQK